MAETLSLSITIDGQPGALKSVQDFTLVQPIFGHHTFSVAVPAESFSAIGTDVFSQIGTIVGKDITIEWATSSFLDRLQLEVSAFKGIVTDVSVSGNRKDHMLVNIRGKSPTILMDGIPNAASYQNQNLEDIYNAAIGHHMKEKLGASASLKFSDPLPYTVQYNETDFDFIKRLFYQHGEMFFYDGQEICLGETKNSKTLNLKPNKVSTLDFNFNMVQPVANVKGRDYLGNAALDLKGESVAPADGVASAIWGESANLYPANATSILAHPAIAEGDATQLNKKLIESRITAARTTGSNNLFTVQATTDMSEIQLGDTISLANFGYEGEYIIVHVSHSGFGKSNYQNHFTAIPVDSGVPPSVHINMPYIESTSAIVSDNKDPEKLGRVRVKFDWGGDFETPWLRMLKPHAGDGRGFYFVPEIDDEVMVGFDMGNPDFPYVLGSMYNGSKKFDSYYDGDDNTKAIRTKSGNEIVFFDGDKKLLIKNEKNMIELDFNGDGTITAKTDGIVNIFATKDINMNADGDINITSKGDTNITAQNIKATAKSNIDLEATKDVGVKGLNTNVEAQVGAVMKGTKTTVEGSATTDVKGGAMTNVSGAMIKLN